MEGFFMKCPHLRGKYVQSCDASKAVYIPSQFEFNEYCNHDGHRICPFYIKADNDEIFADDYYSKQLFLGIR